MEVLRKADILEKHFGTRGPRVASQLSLIEWKSCRAQRSSILPLPYSLPADELLAPVPTVSEIAKCRETENDLTHKRKLKGAWVYRVNDIYAVKFAPDLSIVQVS
jgi:hypothetical protein